MKALYTCQQYSRKGLRMQQPNILLIDDDAELSQLVMDYLTLDGFVLEHAADGVKGLHKAQTGHYQLI